MLLPAYVDHGGGEMTMRRKLLTMLTVLALILVAAVAVATVVYVVGRML